ncbi:MAG: C39 family peptidase [Bacteroidales bacterium]|nr:C39 family peptidase [Bacteroidales bacterium]
MEKSELPLPNASSEELIMSENFEYTFPNGIWDAHAISGYTDAFWDDLTYRSYGGARSAWCADRGTQSSTPSSNYRNNMKARMIYGPFDLSNATDAQLFFYYYNISESNYDYFKWLASTNGTNFYGYQVSGNSGGWKSKTFDLTNVPTLGNLTGQSQVWIAFYFTSDGSSTFEGAYVDDIELKKTLVQQDLQLINESCYVSPSSQFAGQNITVNYRIYNPNSSSILTGLGCSIRPSSGGDWISDTNNDTTVNVPSNYSTQTRTFHIEPYIAPGNYTVGYSIKDGGMSGPYFDTLEKSNELFVNISSPSLYSISPNPSYNGNFTASWSNVQSATSYELQCDTNSSFTTSSNSYNILEQTLGTHYCRVRAKNGSYSSSWSNTQSVLVKLGTPSNLHATGISETAIQLSWQDNSSGVNNEEGFYIHRSSDGNNWLKIGEVNSNNTSYTDNTLTPGLTRYYSIIAFKGSFLSERSNTAQATTFNKGNVTFLVKNEFGSVASNAYIKLYSLDMQTYWDGVTNTSGLYTFYDIPFGNHNYEFHNHQTADETREAWGMGTVTIVSNSTISKTITREIDYIDYICGYQNSAIVDPSSTLMAGSSFDVRINVKNGITSAAHPMRVTLDIDLSQSSPYDETQQQTNTLGPGAELPFSFPYTIPSNWGGQRMYIRGKVEIYYNSTWHQTSLWNWDVWFDVQGDATPPQVISTTPADEQSDWPVDQDHHDIFVEFSEDIDESTIVDSDNFKLLLNSNEIPGTISQVTPTTYKFTTDDDLIYGETYNCLLTTDITDLSGNTLDGNKNNTSEGPAIDNFSFSFSTEMVDGIILDVPYYTQSKSGWCHAASMSMILKYWNIKYSITDIGKYLNIKSDQDVIADAYIPFIENEIGVEFEKRSVVTVELHNFLWTGIYSTKNYIIEKISQDEPIWFSGVVDASVEADTGHTIVVLGFDSEHVYFNDPSGFDISLINTDFYDTELIKYCATWDDFYNKVLGYDGVFDIVEYDVITINDSSLTSSNNKGSIYISNNEKFYYKNIEYTPHLSFIHRSSVMSS